MALFLFFFLNTRKGPQKCHHKPDCSTVLFFLRESDWVYIQQGYSLCAISRELGSCSPESGLSPLVLAFTEGSHLWFVLGHSPWQQCFHDEREELSADQDLEICSRSEVTLPGQRASCEKPRALAEAQLFVKVQQAAQEQPLSSVWREFRELEWNRRDRPFLSGVWNLMEGIKYTGKEMGQLQMKTDRNIYRRAAETCKDIRR